MQPLIFLTVRTIFNGVRRALTSGRRLVSLLVLVGYWTYILFRPMGGNRSTFSKDPMSFHLPFPSLEVLDAGLFFGFLVLSVPLMLSINSYNRTIRPADLDVLFPTPVSPKLVMSLRILRDYLSTLLLPLFFLIVSRRAFPSFLFANLPHPETAPLLTRTVGLSWILLAMTWVVFGYATTLYLGRDVPGADRRGQIVTRTLLGLTLAMLVFIGLSLRQEMSWKNAIAIFSSPFLRIPLFPATIATKFALGPLVGMTQVLLAGGFLLAFLVGGLALSLAQSSWMYDQAAIKGAVSLDALRMRRSGDMMGSVNAAARSGKLKAGRQTRLSRMRLAGGPAIVWRDAVIQTRLTRSAFTVMLILGLIYSFVPLFLMNSLPGGDRHVQTLGVMFIVMQGFALFFTVMGQAQAGFMETLRRMELLKPLPFTPGTLVRSEIVSKSSVGIAFCWLSCIAVTLIKPALLTYAASAALLISTLAPLLAAAVLVSMLLFPDIDDPTQRGFRGIVSLLGISLLAAPGLISFILLITLLHLPLAGAVVGASFNLFLLFIISLWAGSLYLNYNPSE